MGRGGSQAQRVAKGKKMHGHYGHETVTVQNLQVLLVNGMDNIIAISGAVPGPKGSLVTIKSSYKCANMQAKVDLISKSKQVEIQKENEQLEDKDALHKINEEIDAKEALAEEKEAAEAAAAASAKAKAAKEEGEKGGDK
jgi:large subunit ribosomal protein L3